MTLERQPTRPFANAAELRDFLHPDRAAEGESGARVFFLARKNPMIPRNDRQPAPRRPAMNQGFTLVELLVVVSLVALLLPSRLLWYTSMA